VRDFHTDVVVGFLSMIVAAMYFNSGGQTMVAAFALWLFGGLLFSYGVASWRR